MLFLARKESERLNHNFVGSEHLLLGLIRLGQGTGFKILQRLSIEPEAVRREIEKRVGIGPPQKVIGKIPYTPRVSKVLALGAKEAKAMEHSYVGTEHIVMGLLIEGDGVAARVLTSLGVQIERIRQEVLGEPGAEDPGMISPTATGGSISAHLGLGPMEGEGSLTPRAQEVLALARREANQLNHVSIGAEHMLLGLIRLGTGVAVNVLLKLGLDLETVRAEVDRQVGKGQQQEASVDTPYGWAVRRVLAVAHKKAQACRHTYIGTEHILLSLLQENVGVCARVFESLKVDVEKTRQEIVRELNPNATS